jgi:ABC-type transport system involved in cytochrome c biogenesis ATPase subunit
LHGVGRTENRLNALERAHAERLSLSLGDAPVLTDLSFRIGPGLSLVRGGDGRGKTSLLRLLAGRLRPTAGVLKLGAGSVFFHDTAQPARHETQATAWLAEQQARHAAWNGAVAQDLVQAFDLQAHIHKPLFMLSTGSHRKLGLVAAVASGADLTLLDTPHAALDARARGVLDDLLREAVNDARRAWVVADGAVPASLADAVQAGRVGLVDLGD